MNDALRNLAIPTIKQLARHARVLSGKVTQASKEALFATVYESLNDFGDATIQELLPRFHTDHLNSLLCDDPSNFFLLYGPLNIAFGFERLMGYKKEYTGDAWYGVAAYVKRALEREYRP